jgi:hypothetical protein
VGFLIMTKTRFTTRQRALLLAAGLALVGTLSVAAARDQQPPAAPVPAAEALPAGARVARLEIRPAAVELTNPFAYSQLLVTAYLESGEQLDATRLAKIDAPANLVKVSERGQVRPVADGTAELKFALGGATAAVPLKVSGQKEKYEVSFVRDVMPVLSRLGCNAGTCHGSAQGKNGFQLSLRGYDPVLDHRSLTDDIGGRRFNRAAPERSLMLLKTSGAIPHVGAVLTQPGEPYYELIKTWVAEGVKLDLKSPRVTALEIHPRSPVLALPGARQQMAVLATYSDGSKRDVSAEAFLESSNTEVATVDKHGLVTAVRRGETAMLARYEGSYAAASLIVMGDRSGFQWEGVPEYNYIDTLVYEKLKQVKVLPSGLCTDSEFVRRVTLDLTGLPPQPEEVSAFLADPRPSKEKREALVDKLVGSPDFVEHWTNKWADLLQVNRKFLGDQGAAALRGWVRKAVADNMPYDKFCYALLTSSGSNVENPPAAYFKVLRDATGAMENTTHLFLAVRFNCNKCHDHPFERWTQDQYYSLASYFAQVNRTPDPKYKKQTIGGSAVAGALPLVEIIGDRNNGDVKHDRTGAIAPPKFPYTHSDLASDKDPRRVQLARWITSKENAYFAKSYVNRVWSYLLGVGIIEPVDDIRAGNPPTNPKLLDRLTHEFVDSGFDVQKLMKTICKSRTYQHSIATNRWNKDDAINYSHAAARRLPAEVLYDAIHRATGSLSKLPGLPPGARAAQLIDSNVPIPGAFLDLFGRPPRESACECERSTNSIMLGPVLAMVNGPVVAEALRDPNNRITKLVAAEKDDAKVVEALYLALLCRQPTQTERDLGIKTLRETQDEFMRIKQERDGHAAALAAYEKSLPTRQPEWEAKLKAAAPLWTVLEPEVLSSAAGTTLTTQPDGSILATGLNPAPETYTITARTMLSNITAVRLEVMADERLPAKGPGRAQNGNFVLSEFKLTEAPASAPEKAKPVPLQNAKATYSQPGFGVQQAIDNNPQTGWAIAEQFGRTHIAVFETKRQADRPSGTVLTFTLLQQYNGKDHNIGRLRLAVTTARPPVPLQAFPENIAKILHTPAAERTDAQKAELANYQRANDPELARLQRVLADHAIPPDSRTMGAQDLAWALMNSPAFLFNH